MEVRVVGMWSDGGGPRRGDELGRDGARFLADSHFVMVLMPVVFDNKPNQQWYRAILTHINLFLRHSSWLRRRACPPKAHLLTTRNAPVTGGITGGFRGDVIGGIRVGIIGGFLSPCLGRKMLPADFLFDRNSAESFIFSNSYHHSPSLTTIHRRPSPSSSPSTIALQSLETPLTLCPKSRRFPLPQTVADSPFYLFPLATTTTRPYLTVTLSLSPFSKTLAHIHCRCTTSRSSPPHIHRGRSFVFVAGVLASLSFVASPCLLALLRRRPPHVAALPSSPEDFRLIMVIRNEALLLLTHLTREAEIGVVVQDCLELLNNLLRNNSSNQVLLRETIGLDSLISILKQRGSAYSFTQQKEYAEDSKEVLYMPM
ncbi:hypothetical protein PIB30_080240 [Stylosanthes scabra]|uniref:Uncharacterized protein n=1 Tax=Stylosanthes scabra TaxID=79078 RepID=A0ABU6YQG2_9FABA|nr:hypothetical protein [Stylosanthes scabra]